VWKGSAFGGVKGRSEIPSYVERYMAGEIKIDEMVTNQLELSQINEAFRLMKEGASIRSVVLMTPQQG
jgi:S-(hydroxymethyl)glutathione dehydrogenase/alcohol dehydrogenase